MTSNFIVCCCCSVYSVVLCSFKHFSKFEKIKSASTVKKVLQVYAHSALSCLVILLGPRQLLSVLLTNSAEWLQDLLSLKNQDQFVLWHLFVFTCLTSCLSIAAITWFLLWCRMLIPISWWDFKCLSLQMHCQGSGYNKIKSVSTWCSGKIVWMNLAKHFASKILLSCTFN